MLPARYDLRERIPQYVRLSLPSHSVCLTSSTSHRQECYKGTTTSSSHSVQSDLFPLPTTKGFNGPRQYGIRLVMHELSQSVASHPIAVTAQVVPGSRHLPVPAGYPGTHAGTYLRRSKGVPPKYGTQRKTIAKCNWTDQVAAH